jgi:multiple sugar transport system permease protein
VKELGGNRKQLKQDLVGYAFIAPVLIVFIVFMVYPALEAVRISLFDIQFNNSRFTGLDNFYKLANDPVFLKALVNTFKYVLYIVPLTMAFSIMIAVLINKKNQKGASFYRGIFYIPTIASAVTVSLVWNWIYNPVIGIANYLLSWLGLPAQAWLAMPDTAFGAVVFVILTTSVGQPIILYTAALDGVSKEYYEAAAIDGANKFRQFLSITWPLVKPTSLYILVITTIHAFQTFVAIQLLTQGGPFKSTTSIIYELYETAFQYHNFGYASAMGVVLLIIIGIVSFFQFKLMTEKIEY